MHILSLGPPDVGRHLVSLPLEDSLQERRDYSVRSTENVGAENKTVSGAEREPKLERGQSAPVRVVATADDRDV